MLEEAGWAIICKDMLLVVIMINAVRNLLKLNRLSKFLHLEQE